MASEGKKAVILDMQGAPMDFVNLIAILSSPDLELLGVTVTNSGCFPLDGVETTFRVLSLFNRKDIPVSKSRLNGRNPIPTNTRGRAKMIGALSELIVQEIGEMKVDPLPADQFLIEKVTKNAGKVNILCTGPPVNVALALENEAFRQGVNHIVVQGGSLGPKGNVCFYNHNGKGEVRFFWEPVSVQKLLSFDAPLTLSTIDGASAFELFDDFLPNFGHSQRQLVETLVAEILAFTVADVRGKFSKLQNELCGIFSLLRPELFTRRTETLIVGTEEPQEGVLIQDASGRKIEVLEISAENAEKVLAGFFDLIRRPNTITLPRQLQKGTYKTQSVEQVRRKVFFDMDGAVDDVFGLMMILNMPHIELLGVGVTGADCFLADGLQVVLKLLYMYGKEDVKVSASTLNLRNSFPTEWRIAAKLMDSSPLMIGQKYNEHQKTNLPSHLFLIDVLERASEPITVFITGPFVNLARAITMRPDLKTKIKEVVAMGGAIFVPGNVDVPGHDGSAEWNVYTDPQGYHTVLRYEIRVVLFTLDSTNNVPLSYDLLKKFALQNEFSASSLLNFFMAQTTINIPSDIYTYFLWDTLAAAYLGSVNFCDLKPVEIDIDLEEPSLGRTRPVDHRGFVVQMAENVDLEPLYAYLFDLFKFNLKLETPE